MKTMTFKSIVEAKIKIQICTRNGRRTECEVSIEPTAGKCAKINNNLLCGGGKAIKINGFSSETMQRTNECTLNGIYLFCLFASECSRCPTCYCCCFDGCISTASHFYLAPNLCQQCRDDHAWAAWIIFITFLHLH